MAFTIPSFDRIRTDILRDLKSLNPDVDTAPDSDYYVRASSIASCASGQYAHQAWIVRQIFPDTADSEFLELHCALRHIFRKSATASTAIVTFKGAAKAAIPKGTEIKANNAAVIFTTLKTVRTTNIGVATVSAISNTNGIAANIVAQKGTCLSAPSGIDSTVELSDAVGATNEEPDASLLARLLSRLRRPPAGGNANDYKQWALSIDGVDDTYIYPLRRGAGTVDIAITAADGLPSVATIKACQDYIDSVRPVTAKGALVLAPEIVNIDISYKAIFQGASDVVKVNVTRALAEYFATIKPNDSLVLSKINAVISDTTGVVDHLLVQPNSNVNNATNRIIWYKLGNVSSGAL
ncbi:MAG: baseplate J/gp47 family protein [Gammaproteobacteria bacterium]|nr:baseplate J/gp47 family protein [Gammaproteobacteria bacterium]